MKKMTILVALVATCALYVTGCKTATNKSYRSGAFAGMAAYSGYMRVLDRMPDDNPAKEKIRTRVEALWKIVDSLSTNNNYSVIARDIRTASEELYKAAGEDGTEAGARNVILLTSIYKTYSKKVSTIETSTNDEKALAAVKWLIAFREGVKLMYSIDTGSIWVTKDKPLDDPNCEIALMVSDNDIVDAKRTLDALRAEDDE